MDKKLVEDIVAFCILMQNGDGILGKAPSYIHEKFTACMSGYHPLDSKNMSILKQYFETWYNKEEA